MLLRVAIRYFCTSFALGMGALDDHTLLLGPKDSGRDARAPSPLPMDSLLGAQASCLLLLW